jgi:hypothetical protein
VHKRRNVVRFLKLQRAALPRRVARRRHPLPLWPVYRN